MNRQIKVGVVLQYLQMGLSILISLIYTPFMLRILGQSEYGLYNLSSSVISYLSLLSLGFGASYVRYYYLKKKSDPDGIKYLNGLYLFVFICIGIIALISGLFLSFNVSIFFNETYTEGDKEIAKVLMLFLTGNLAISFPMSLFVSYITAQEKFIFNKLINMGKTILSPALSIIALFMGYGSIGLVAITSIVNLIVDIFNIFFCFKKLKMKISFKKLDFRLAKDIFVFSIFIAINQIIDQINWQTDKLVLAKIVSSAAVSIYGIGSVINTLYISFSTAISSLFSPKVNMIWTDKEKTTEKKNEELSYLFAKVGNLQFIVLMLALTGFIFFGKPFIQLWAGEDYSDSYYIALFLITPATLSLITNLGIEIRRCKNKHKIISLVMLGTAILNLGLTIPFTLMWSYFGAAFATTISLVVNFIIICIFNIKILKINYLFFLSKVTRTSVFLIIPVALGIMCCVFLPAINNWLMFFIYGICYTTIYVISFYLLGLTRPERETIWKRIRKR